MHRYLHDARRPVAVLLAVSYLSGCGLVFQGTRQNVVATSSPDAARVTTTPATGEYQTPITLRLERKKSYSLKFEKAGYAPASVEVANHIQAGFVILDIVLGLVPVIIDAATGAWYKLEPGAALVAMTRVAQGPGPDVIYVGLSSSVRDGTRLIEVSTPGVSVEVTER